MTHDDPALSPSLLSVLQHIHTYTWTLQNDDARKYAFEVAVAAYNGFISTEVLPGYPVHGRVWKITAKGLAHLTRNASIIAEDELARFMAKPVDPEMPPAARKLFEGLDDGSTLP